MLRINSLSPTLPSEAAFVAPKTGESTDLAAERTQALTRRLDETLTTRLASIRQRVRADNPAHLGRVLDIEA